MKALSLSMTIWSAGLAGVIGVDYALRVIMQKPYELGFSSGVWFGAHAVLALASVMPLLAWILQRNRVQRGAIALLVVGLGLGYYVCAIWLYVVGTGVDSV